MSWAIACRSTASHFNRTSRTAIPQRGTLPHRATAMGHRRRNPNTETSGHRCSCEARIASACGTSGRWGAVCFSALCSRRIRREYQTHCHRLLPSWGGDEETLRYVNSLCRSGTGLNCKLPLRRRPITKRPGPLLGLRLKGRRILWGERRRSLGLIA
jgi:hypothetical protein